MLPLGSDLITEGTPLTCVANGPEAGSPARRPRGDECMQASTASQCLSQLLVSNEYVGYSLCRNSGLLNNFCDSLAQCLHLCLSKIGRGEISNVVISFTCVSEPSALVGI